MYVYFFTEGDRMLVSLAILLIVPFGKYKHFIKTNSIGWHSWRTYNLGITSNLVCCYMLFWILTLWSWCFSGAVPGSWQHPDPNSIHKRPDHEPPSDQGWKDPLQQENHRVWRHFRCRGRVRLSDPRSVRFHVLRPDWTELGTVAGDDEEWPTDCIQ